jgi:phosphoribosylformimino-5-aminoimidazole carboxamide ribotide isomerase
MTPPEEQAGGAASANAPRSSPRPLLVIPAVDLLAEEAVRLEQGDYDRVRVRAGDPESLVARFAGAGAALVHVVDLDGARTGRVRPELMGRLAAAAQGVPVQASGGIRSVDDAEALLSAGASRVVVGTAAFAEPAALGRFVSALSEQLVVALDARGEQLAVAGWAREAGISVDEAALRCADAGVTRLHCTAIERDGTMAGPDLDLLARVRDRSGLPVIAAGGIRSAQDLEAIARLGLEGAVVGRALVEGTLPLSILRRWSV